MTRYCLEYQTAQMDTPRVISFDNPTARDALADAMSLVVVALRRFEEGVPASPGSDGDPRRI